MRKWSLRLVALAASAAALAVTASTAAADNGTILANAGSNAWSDGVYLCTPQNGPQPTVVPGAELATALAGGSRYANSIVNSTAIQPNNTGTASLRCDVPAGAVPLVGPDGSQMVADGNGTLYPASMAGLGSIGYPVYEKAAPTAAANTGAPDSTATAAAAATGEAGTSSTILANASSNTWGDGVYLCTPENGPQPTVVPGSELAAALAGGSRYANSITKSVAIQPNATGTASLRCDVPAGATPIVAADGTQMVADVLGNLYPASMAGLGSIGYPAFTGP